VIAWFDSRVASLSAFAGQANPTHSRGTSSFEIVRFQSRFLNEHRLP
jgi:hypothetical protein